MNSRISQALFWGLAVSAGFLLMRNTSLHGPDFGVYYEAARRWWAGGAVYPCTPPEVMAFKYPPWIFPVFLPFGLLSPEAAHGVWGAVQALSLLGVMIWLRSRVHIRTLALVVGFFWGILTVHAFDGQISLPLTALALGAAGSGVRAAALVYPLSAKIFTLFPLLGQTWRGRNLLTAALIGLLFIPLSVPALKVSPDPTWSGLIRCWQQAAGLAIDAHGGVPVSLVGDQAQGFVSMVGRAISIDITHSKLVLILVVILAFVVASVWGFLSRGLRPDVRWAGWVALTATVQPLAGFHTFVMALPLAALTLDSWLRTPRRLTGVFTVLGLVCVTLLTQKTLGEVGLWLQWASVKSWGVLFLCLAAARNPEFRR